MQRAVAKASKAADSIAGILPNIDRPIQSRDADDEGIIYQLVMLLSTTI